MQVEYTATQFRLYACHTTSANVIIILLAVMKIVKSCRVSESCWNPDDYNNLLGNFLEFKFGPLKSFFQFKAQTFQTSSNHQPVTVMCTWSCCPWSVYNTVVASSKETESFLVRECCVCLMWIPSAKSQCYHLHLVKGCSTEWCLQRQCSCSCILSYQDYVMKFGILTTYTT